MLYSPVMPSRFHGNRPSSTVVYDLYIVTIIDILEICIKSIDLLYNSGKLMFYTHLVFIKLMIIVKIRMYKYILIISPQSSVYTTKFN